MQAQDHASFDASAVERGASTPVPARAVIPAGPDDAAIRFMAHDSDVALAWRPYRLHVGARLLLGRTDEHGFTCLLSAAERAGVTDWEID